MKIEESVLISQLQNNSTRKESFGKLVSIYSEKLYWQIRKIVISHDDANDVLQEVFIKVWNSISNFRGDSKLSTWLYKVAVNESITFVNKRKHQNNISVDDNLFLLNNIEGDAYFDGDEAQLLLQKAILSLPEKQRVVFQMKYLEELKYEDMSAILNTSVGALKASYHHAVKKIEAFFSEID